MSTRPLAQYSLLDPAVQADPFECYAKLHQECPVYRMPETGMYVVTRFEDLAHVLRTPKDFSSEIRSRAGLQGDGANLHQDIIREQGHARSVARGNTRGGGNRSRGAALPGGSV